MNCTKDFFYQWIIWQLNYEINDNEFKENYHIDHCPAIETFDLSDPGNQFKAVNWQNTQPLLKSKNLNKGAKRDLWSEVMQELKVIVFLKLYYPEKYSNIEKP